MTRKQRPLILLAAAAGLGIAVVHAQMSTTSPTTATTMATTYPSTTQPTTPSVAAAMRLARIASTLPTSANALLRRSLAGTPAPSRFNASDPAQDYSLYSRTRPISTEYSVLLDRSIFVQGRQNVSEVRSSTPIMSSSNTTRTNDYVRPEANFVFSGVTESATTDAFIEDMTTHHVALYHVGDTIARGRITQIDFDNLQYESNGKSTSVAIGDNMDGDPVTLPSSESTALSTPPAGAPPVPGAPASTPGTPAAPGATPATSAPPANLNSIIEQMRRRRAAGG